MDQHSVSLVEKENYRGNPSISGVLLLVTTVVLLGCNSVCCFLIVQAAD
jgi:hypothetical protein